MMNPPNPNPLMITPRIFEHVISPISEPNRSLYFTTILIYFAALTLFLKSPHDPPLILAMTIAVLFLALAAIKSRDNYLRISSMVSVGVLMMEAWRQG